MRPPAHIAESHKCCDTVFPICWHILCKKKSREFLHRKLYFIQLFQGTSHCHIHFAFARNYVMKIFLLCRRSNHNAANNALFFCACDHDEKGERAMTIKIFDKSLISILKLWRRHRLHTQRVLLQTAAFTAWAFT